MRAGNNTSKKKLKRDEHADLRLGVKSLYPGPGCSKAD